MAEAALRLRGIRKRYGAIAAVDGADIDVFPGEIHALVGENGAGKSTLAAIAYGAVKPDAGTIEAHGTVGLVHQHFALIERLTHLLVEPIHVSAACTSVSAVNVRDVPSCGQLLQVRPDALGVGWPALVAANPRQHRE